MNTLVLELEDVKSDDQCGEVCWEDRQWWSSQSEDEDAGRDWDGEAEEARGQELACLGLLS